MKKAYFFVTVFALFFLISCGTQVSDEEMVRKVIGKYNSALMPAYKDGNFGQLMEVADGKALTLVTNTYQSFLNGNGIVLDSEVLSVEFEKIELGSGDEEDKIEVAWHEEDKEWREVYVYNETFVDTKEKWHYKWVDKTTGEHASPAMTINYTMSYTLDRVEGRLKVIKTRIVKEEILKSEGESERWKELTMGHS